MTYSATCTDCKTTIRFNTYLERSEWVGKHRVRTGHSVTQEK